MEKKYIAYRYYVITSAIWLGGKDGYERTELSEKELTPYIKKHLGELKNIEIFTKENKIKIDINVSLEEK